MKKTTLSVVIPCYNESENIKRGVLQEIQKYMRRQKYSWEVIISDDGSTDDSYDLVKKRIKKWKNFRHLKNAHGSKPYAIWQGLKKAKGKYVLFCDMDQSTPINQTEKLLELARGGFNAVIGSRGIRRKDFPLYRKLGSAVFMTIRKSVVLPEIEDTQCGFKMFERELVKKAFPKLEFFKSKKEVRGWSVTSYDVELLQIIKKMGERIKEAEVVWQEKDISRSAKGGMSKYVKESVDMLKQIARVKINDLRGYYDT